MLVISGCTRHKAAQNPNQLTLDDFRNPERRDTKNRDLGFLALPARQMYRGEEHERTIAALDALRAEAPGRQFEHRIVSAGYGLIDQQAVIVPYEATFDGMSDEALADWSSSLLLEADVRAAMRHHKQIALILPWTHRRAIGPIAAEPGAHLIHLDPFGEQRTHLQTLADAPRPPTGFASVAEDRRFLRDFEAAALTKEQWTHRAHLRMAWLMAEQGPVRETVPRVKRALHRLLNAFGITQTETTGYHETVTRAWLQLIGALRELSKASCAEVFIDQHPQLLDKTHLLTFFSRPQLMDPRARSSWIPPDLRPLPGTQFT
ncbi:MAG: hypothetical protein ACI9WU_005294 [Myxococcota bacterium]|jgi:hypothetical protein